MTDSHRDLDSVEFRSVFTEALSVSQVHEKFASTNEPHHEEYLLVGHEDVAHSHEEWVISLQQNILLKLG